MEETKIIEDIEVLSERADELDIRHENQKMRETILELKRIIKEKNLTHLTAPQIGVNLRLFVINFNGQMKTYINPIITNVKGFELAKETCPSLPGKTYIRPRNNDIVAMYQTPLGKIENKRFVGMAAIVFQHSIDHLDGLLLSDIGMEIGEDFEKATDEEKEEVILMYLKSLDIDAKSVKENIENDAELKNITKAIDFVSDVNSGKVKIEKEKIVPVPKADPKEIKESE